METILCISIYILGYICAYLILRYCARRDWGQWKISDRNIVFGMCILSWLSVVGAMIILLTSGDNERDANW